MAEIERKFLVNCLPDLQGSTCSNLLQVYISINPEIRIRRDGENFFLTKKGDGLLIRDEQEVEITKEVFDILSSMILGNIIQKRRYRVPIGESLTAELDIYYENLIGLMTVEVEFPTEEAAASFSKPVWFGEDITLDKRFKNKALSQLDSIDKLIDINSDTRALVKKNVQ